MDRTCDSCGKVIPNSVDRAMSDIDTYWCDACEGSNLESAEDLEQRLSDRRTLGVAERPDNPLGGG